MNTHETEKNSPYADCFPDLVPVAAPDSVTHETETVVTQPRCDSDRGRPVTKPLSCDYCRLPIKDTAPVLFAQELRGCAPFSGQLGWYTATAHLDPCGIDHLRAFRSDYVNRPCRGCRRRMHTRLGSRRTHCSSRCRQADYRRRRDLVGRELAAGRYLPLADAYWLTRPTDSDGGTR